MTKYQDYMASPEWDKRRKAEFIKAKRTCVACGNRAQNIHHRTYARLGHEAEGDLVALCRHCHLLAHLYEIEHPGISLWDATNALIREHRELFALPPVELPEQGTVRREARKATAALAPPARREHLRSPAKVAKRQARLDRKAERYKVKVDTFFATEGPPISAEEIKAASTPSAGWTRKQLAAWGVPWPPPKGWKSHLTCRGTTKQGSQVNA